MPIVNAGDLPCYYRIDGRSDRPVIVLAHALGLDHGMWDAQTAQLLPHFQVLRYDIRGHGASGVPDGDYRIEELGADVIALTAELGIQTFAFCGLSLGGMIGLWIAANAPERLTAVVLANTTPRVADPAAMEARRLTVTERGMAAVVDAAMSRFFSPAMLAADATEVAWARRTLLSIDPSGYAGCCAAIRDMDQTAVLPGITVPALVIAGDLDVSMPWTAHGEVMALGIPGARAVRLPAAHLSNLEAPRAFTDAIFDCLLLAPDDPIDRGFSARRAVLGHSHVDGAIASTTEFTREFQDLITRYAWGTIWTRPGLDHRTRRRLVLTTTAALGRWEEYRLHVRAGLRHGLETCDIKEVLLQAAVYAGVPAANTGFQIAAEEIEALGREAGTS
jgi:3-oxoadipate enol-lactonase/4-carboxymuconolactone decarboxylase